MTQVVLADCAGVGLRFLRELEQGKTKKRLEDVREIAKLKRRVDVVEGDIKQIKGA